jgi:hypothetical protein
MISTNRHPKSEPLMGIAPNLIIVWLKLTQLSLEILSIQNLSCLILIHSYINFQYRQVHYLIAKSSCFTGENV